MNDSTLTLILAMYNMICMHSEKYGNTFTPRY